MEPMPWMAQASPQRRPSSHRLLTRALYIALALGTIVLGLAVHWRGGPLGPTLRDVLGDALWAAMIAWWVGALAPGASLRIRALGALSLCFGVEVSQLYHTTALDALRGTVAGQLVLGSGFDPRDLVAYTLGVLVAAFLERSLIRRHETVAAATP
jgi:hypothetical protein